MNYLWLKLIDTAVISVLFLYWNVDSKTARVIRITGLSWLLVTIWIPL